MNNHNPIIIIAACLLGALTCVSVFLGEGNILANLFLYLIAGSSLIALVSPKMGFYVCLISAAYVDMLKRLMVVSDRIQMQDLYYVLGFTPVTFGVVTLALFIRGLIGRQTFTGADLRRLAAASLIALANTALLLLSAGSDGGGGLKEAANGGLYGMLIFVTPLLFPKSDDLLRLFKSLLWIFAPVAVYGVTQYVWGFRDFELEYLRTGLSIEIKQLFTDRVRAFSTLNSPTSLGAICAAFTALPLFLWGQRTESGKRHLSLPAALLLTVIFLAAMAASTSRTGILLITMSAVGYWCFTSRMRTTMFYVSSFIAFIAMLLTATYLQGRLDDISQFLIGLGGGLFSEETLNVNTFSDRLQGFSHVLTNPDAYTLFGYGPMRGKDPTDPLYNHDLFSSTLVRYGSIALFVMVLIGIGFLWFSHRSLLNIQNPNKRRIGSMMLALAMGLIAISGISGNVLSIFPVNIIFWLVVAAALMNVDGQRNAARRAQQAPVQKAAPTDTPGPTRFRPTARPNFPIA
ncbi:MAG: hypothetical protein ABL974_10445 [Prosthecobacter sp.]